MIEILHPTTDAARIAELLDPASGWQLVDGWQTALPELAAIDQPRFAAGTHEARSALADYLAAAREDGSIESATRYIVYPWRNTVVKLPDAEHFLRLRTARNRYLLDDDEQRAWSSALIGVAGLSVGASALAVCSLTGARRFRLAERDTLGPTNMNRLSASICDLGLPKLLLALRRTAECDPYSEMTPFPDGYAPATATEFLGGARADAGHVEPLTVLIEEMDDLAMKIDIRRRARAARIPVVMVSDHGDNAFLDVERYDIDPDYPLFHGRAGNLADLSAADLNDPHLRVRLVSAIVGGDITPRSRFSLTQVGRTLPSWPQLGTAVTVAGALAAFAARLIACGGDIGSGRYRVDLDRILLGRDADAFDRWNELGEREFLATIQSA
jgi:hypothetical protein